MILHTACLLAERRGIEIVAPIHDAFVVQCDARDVEDVSAALDRVMRDASAVVLRGYELPTDCQIIRPGERYFDKRGKAMWDTVTGLLAKRETGERVMGDPDLSDLWLKGDDGLGPAEMDGAPPRPAKGYILVPVDWLARVWPLLRSAQQVLVLQLIYRRCLIRP